MPSASHRKTLKTVQRAHKTTIENEIAVRLLVPLSVFGDD